MNLNFLYFYLFKSHSTNPVQQSLLVNKQAVAANIISKPTKSVQSIVKQPQVINKRNIVLNMKTMAPTPTVTTQPTIGRIVKPGISFVQKIPQTGTSSVKVADTQNTYVAKVMTPGAKSHLINTGNRQIYNAANIEQTTNQVVQMASGSNMQIPHYTVVSQSRPILTSTAQQRLVSVSNAIQRPVVRTTATNSE